MAGRPFPVRLPLKAPLENAAQPPCDVQPELQPAPAEGATRADPDKATRSDPGIEQPPLVDRCLGVLRQVSPDSANRIHRPVESRATGLAGLDRVCVDCVPPLYSHA